MQYLNTVTTPLPANGTFTDSVAVDPDFPYLTVSALADVAGSIVIAEWEQTQQTDPSVRIVASVPVKANVQQSFNVQFTGAFYRITFINGATAQASLSLSYGSSIQQAETATRLQVLILRELRAQSLLLANLKEPTGTQVNIPFGTDQVTPL